MSTDDVELRRARVDEAAAVADLVVDSRAANAATIPPMAHDRDDVRRHAAAVWLARHETWVAQWPGGAITGVLVLAGDWVDQLYVAAGATGGGIGSRLLAQAKQLRPGGLQLWTFATNVGAQRFYQRHGLVAVERTDGAANEEGAPDIRYEWRPAG